MGGRAAADTEPTPCREPEPARLEIPLPLKGAPLKTVGGEASPLWDLSPSWRPPRMPGCGCRRRPGGSAAAEEALRQMRGEAAVLRPLIKALSLLSPPSARKRFAATPSPEEALAKVPHETPAAVMAAVPADEEWALMRRAVDGDIFARLCELRAQVAHFDGHAACVVEPHARRATTLLRFLRARSMDAERAAALFGEAMAWRAEFEVDRKLAAWRAEWAEGASERAKLLRAHDYVRFCGLDRRGCPVYLHQMAQCDPVGIAREAGEETVLLHLLRTFEEQTAAMRAQFLETGSLSPGCVDLYDTGNYAGVPGTIKRGLGMVPLYMGFARVFDVVYPERVHVAFVVRAPRLFDVVWRVAYSRIPEATRRKVRVFGPACAAWLEELGALVPPESIPTWLRTDDALAFAEATRLGGMVPRRG